MYSGETVQKTKEEKKYDGGGKWYVALKSVVSGFSVAGVVFSILSVLPFSIPIIATALISVAAGTAVAIPYGIAKNAKRKEKELKKNRLDQEKHEQIQGEIRCMSQNTNQQLAQQVNNLKQQNEKLKQDISNNLDIFDQKQDKDNSFLRHKLRQMQENLEEQIYASQRSTINSSKAQMNLDTRKKVQKKGKLNI